MSANRFILRAVAPDGIGILANVMTHLASHRLNVTENHDFADPQSQRFFIWAKFEAEEGFDVRAFEDGFQTLATFGQTDFFFTSTGLQMAW